MFAVELPEVHTISPDPVLYDESHNRGITSSKNISVSTKLAFYLLRQFVPSFWLSVVGITWCCDIDVLVWPGYGGRVTSNEAEKVRYEEEIVHCCLYVQKKESSLWYALMQYSHFNNFR
jgi:hypothetical protein